MMNLFGRQPSIILLRIYLFIFFNKLSENNGVKVYHNNLFIYLFIKFIHDEYKMK